MGSNPTSRRRAEIALGLALARRGALAKVSIALGALVVLGAFVAAVILSRRSHAPLDRLPSLASSALAWGAGVLLAFAAAAHALLRDRTDGVRALLSARGSGTRGYLWARIGGLALLLALVVGGGTLLAGLAAVLVAGRAGVLPAIQGTGAATAYGVAFAISVAPVALAALGARSRAGGYLWFVLVLVFPEVLEPWLSSAVPDWGDLLSLPGALAALRRALMPPGVNLALLVRSAVVLGAATAIAIAIVRAEIARVDAEPRE
jgi:hypothetical protein